MMDKSARGSVPILGVAGGPLNQIFGTLPSRPWGCVMQVWGVALPCLAIPQEPRDGGVTLDGQHMEAAGLEHGRLGWVRVKMCEKCVPVATGCSCGSKFNFYRTISSTEAKRWISVSWE